MMLFWAIFLPLGDQWSIDRIKSGRSLPESQQSQSPNQYRMINFFLFIYLFIKSLISYRTYLVWWKCRLDHAAVLRVCDLGVAQVRARL